MKGKIMAELENLLKRKHKVQINGIKYKLKKFLEHELQEIKFSLDRVNPNINMALERVKNIEKHLKTF